MTPLRVLITNMSLCGRTGTETYTRDLALALRALGHEPAVYSPRVGKLADELKAAGIAVSSDIRSFTAPNIIHGQHNLPMAIALLSYSNAPAVFVCHDATAWHDEPPRFAAIQHYIAVDFRCRERLKADGIPEEQISVIGNSVDLDRFQLRGPLPPRPKRALLFSNYATEHTHLGVVREACANAGLQLDVRGYGVGNVCEKPEAILGDYDIVFAKARCAMEAMACGAAVILCGAEGAGPIAANDQFDALREYNFGRHTLRKPLNAKYLADQIARYDPAEARKVTELARAKLSLGNMVQQWLDLYRTIQPVSQPKDDTETMMRLLMSLEPKLFRLSDTESRLAWLEAAHRDKEHELSASRKKLRKAVRLRGILKRLWTFGPTRAALRILGVQALER